MNAGLAYAFDRTFDRNRIRFVGIGPRVHGESGKSWPKDCIDPSDELRKILSDDHKFLSPVQLNPIEHVITNTFRGLKNANINKLFNKYCEYKVKMFNHVPQGLNAYTQHKNILDLVFHVLLAINSTNKTNDSNLLKILFGGNRNYDIFKESVEWLVIGNKQFRDISVGRIIHSCDDKQMSMTTITWLSCVEDSVTKYRIFTRTIQAVVNYILELLRRYFYITFSNPHYQKLFYFRYDLWQKIKNMKISQLVSQGVLEMVPSGNSFDSLLVSKIKFHCKYDDLRLICTRSKLKTSDSVAKHSQLKAILCHILDKYPNYRKFSLDRLLISLQSIKARRRIEEIRKEVYFVRTDIKDCFQNIDQEFLRSIIVRKLRALVTGNVLTLHPFLMKVKTKQFIKWSLDPKILGEQILSPTLIRYNKQQLSIDDFDQQYLRPRLVNPILKESKEGKILYHLTKGLEQGSSVSPLYCSIYIQEAFDRHLQELQSDEECELFCYMDDILFISTNEGKARIFMSKMLNGFQEFNLTMNPDKMYCNFIFENCKQYLFKDPFVIFYRHRISLDTLECSYEYKCSPLEIQDTINISPYSAEKEIMRSIKKKSWINFIILDCKLNGVRRVVENMFEKSLYFAHMAAAMVLKSFKMRNHQIHQNPRFIISIIGAIQNKFSTVTKRGVSKRHIAFNLTNIEILSIVAVAFEVTWRSGKMKCRRKEYKEIRHFVNKLLDYHPLRDKKRWVRTNSNPSPWLVDQLQAMMRHFFRSNFHKKMILPSKRSTSRQVQQSHE